MWLYHLFSFGLRRLLCDLRPDISIASISTAVHAPRKLEGGGPNFRQSTSFWYMFLNSKMLFRSGFVFSRIRTTELIFYQLLLSLDRSLKLIWIVYVIRNFSFTLQRLWCTQLQLDSNTFVFPKQDIRHATGLHFQESPARGSLRKNSPPRPDPAGNPRGRGTSGIPDIPYEIINSSHRSTSTLGITSLNFCSSVMSCINNG